MPSRPHRISGARALTTPYGRAEVALPPRGCVAPTPPSIRSQLSPHRCLGFVWSCRHCRGSTSLYRLGLLARYRLHVCYAAPFVASLLCPYGHARLSRASVALLPPPRRGFAPNSVALSVGASPPPRPSLRSGFARYARYGTAVGGRGSAPTLPTVAPSLRPHPRFFFG